MKRSIKKWRWRRRASVLMGRSPNPGLTLIHGGEVIELGPGDSVEWLSEVPNRWDDWEAARKKRRHARLWAPRSHRWDESPLPARLQRPVRTTPPPRAGRAQSYEVSATMTLEPGAAAQLFEALRGGVLR